jgi:hypothetical protein
VIIPPAAFIALPNAVTTPVPVVVVFIPPLPPLNTILLAVRTADCVTIPFVVLV